MATPPPAAAQPGADGDLGDTEHGGGVGGRDLADQAEPDGLLFGPGQLVDGLEHPAQAVRGVDLVGVVGDVTADGDLGHQRQEPVGPAELGAGQEAGDGVEPRPGAVPDEGELVTPPASCHEVSGRPTLVATRLRPRRIAIS